MTKYINKKSNNSKRSKKSKNIKSSKNKKIKKSKYRDDPIGHRKSLYGRKFTVCYDKFNKKKKDTKSGNSTLESTRNAVKYLEKHFPKCIEIIGEYLIDH